MGVTIAQRGEKVWYEFPGKFQEIWHDEVEGEDPYQYRAWISGHENHICFDHYRFEDHQRRVKNSRIDVGPDWVYSQLEVPVVLFKRVVRSLQWAKSRRDLGDYGTFQPCDSQVIFILPCNDRHIFELEDLLILVDQLA